MGNIGNVSTININGNEMTIKDAAVREIVNEIISAIDANNSNIAERINDLHKRSFDYTIEITSNNESEIINIQDGIYKLQYVTVTGSGDNEVRTLNNSAILVQSGIHQYLYKDGKISGRIKTNNSWGEWESEETPHKLSANYEMSSDMNDELLLEGGDTYEEAFGKIEKAILDNESVTSNTLNVLQSKINNIPIYNSSNKLSADFIENGETNKVINIKPDWNAAAGSDSEILNKPTIPTVPSNVSSFNNDANYATTTDVNTAISNLVNSAPSTLDTLNELATALGNDANFSTTVTNSIAKTREIAEKKLINYSKEYLTFEAIQDTTFTFTNNTLQYSLDNGITWATLGANTASPTITAGKTIMWKQTGLTPNSTGIGTFSATGNFKAYGNIMSLYYGDNFIEQTSLSGKNYAFYGLFSGNTKLIDVSDLILPATTLSQGCYTNMFAACSNLVNAPKLPATTLAASCYGAMFVSCTNLTTAPELPATTLAVSCYNAMFVGCTSLTIAPELPATTLITSCYGSMFMGCTNLNYIKCLAIDISDSSSLGNWISGIASSGIFIKATSMTSWTIDDYNGIHSGWSVYNDNEDKDIKQYELNVVLNNKLNGYYKTYLTFEAIQNTTFTFTNNTLQYSLDNGITWTTLVANSASPTITAGKTIMWKQTSLTPNSTNGIGTFSATGNYKVYGNIMSLLYGDNFIGQTSLSGKNYAFYNLFYTNTHLIDSSNLILPAITLSEGCYSFMFSGCTNLINTPVLPATTLAKSCYERMFNGCSSLTIAPELPAATLVSRCYYSLFNGCSNLNYIKCLATTITSATNNWTKDVGASGTFIKNDNMSSWSTGVNGIPSGWTVYKENEYKEVKKYELATVATSGSYNDLTNKPTPCVSILYSDLVTLRNQSNLIPGTYYRITDYVTTTTQPDTQSAGHAFDIIVRANEVNKLNENAYAAVHSGDTYFSNSKLEAWELKYCLDNESTRFAWADSTNGKGVIYYMKDEFNNECPYDFKNIQFKVGENSIPGTVANVFYYTFSVATGSNDTSVTDHSLNGSTCWGNKIGIHITDKIQLNKIVFRNTSVSSQCHSNTFGEYCYSNIFGNNCYSNIFGNHCYLNTFGNYCEYDTFGNYCWSNTFGNTCYDNTFSNSCYYNTFGNSCSYNTFGDDCRRNMLGTTNSPKSYVKYIIFENGNRDINLDCSATTSVNNQFQNITIAQGVNNTNTTKIITHPTAGDTFKTTYQPINSQIINV